MKSIAQVMAVATAGAVSTLSCGSGSPEPVTAASVSSQTFDEADAVVGTGTEVRKAEEVNYPLESDREGYTDEEAEKKNLEDPEVD